MNRPVGFPPLRPEVIAKVMRRPRFVRPAPSHLHRQVEREDALLNARKPVEVEGLEVWRALKAHERKHDEPADLGSIIAVIVLLAAVPWMVLLGMAIVGWLA